jgi:glyoxylase-like metal-dependent hydrolase (beta-lactamase superfamily II)
MAGAPTSLTIFSYQVGFGDCFLLRFVYDDGPRHVLIDFGTTKLPETAPKDQMLRVARDIADKCGHGGLTAVVATHRHADHISGFATRNGEGSGDVIRALNPRLVLQPWTEAKDAAIDSLGPVVSSDKRSMAQRLAGLNAMHAISEQVLRMIETKALGKPDPEVLGQLEFLGQDNLSNKSAVENLMTMGEKRVYAFHGSDSGLGDLLPGVETIVLGPPTLHQTETIKKQKSRDPDEYWHLSAAALESDFALSADDDASLFPGHPTCRATRLPMETRWFARRVDQARSGQLLSLVRSLDNQMNNTSLILLFEVGGKKLLFPGDAQIENWRYALNSEFASKLEDVDLYKVGHHGSLNATPKSLWNAFRKKSSDEDREGRLTTMLSTMPGKHGHEKDHTEVPRQTLLKDLEDQSELHSTHRLEPDALFQEVTITF